MRKRCTLLFILFFISNFLGSLIAQTYQVQLASFTENIDLSFFEFAGYTTVYKERDHNNFNRYTLGEFFTLKEAKEIQNKAIEKGFLNTHIIILDRPQYAYAGDSYNIPLIMVPEKEPLFIRSIQFSNEDMHLNKDLIHSLEESLKIMIKNPHLKLKITGHTDAIGEKAVNQKVSKKRARMIQNFLLANGIPAYRLQMNIAKEPFPDVYFKGKGLPKNRDFNRRIVMSLVDLKEEVVVDSFQNETKKEFGKTLSSANDFAKLMKFIKLV